MTNQELLMCLYKGTTTYPEFIFEKATAPPLYSLVPMQACDMLYNVINDIGLSGKPDKKYEIIDKIMHEIGFKRLAGGTNRLVYNRDDYPDICVKVAIDKEGMKNNLDEYKVQFLLKPFCCKVYDVEPQGVVGLFEQVIRITSREQFIDIADCIFEVITKVFLGKYVMEDIGTYYMFNWGIRYGFGPVLLDFPYVYELDGSSLLCTHIFENRTICRGEIDYDPGFNYLYCRKCGKRYRAIELSKTQRGVFIPSILKGEDVSMKVVVSKGDNVIKIVDTKDTDVQAKQYSSRLEKKVIRKDKPITDGNNLRTLKAVGTVGRMSRKDAMQKYVDNYGANPESNKKRKDNIGLGSFKGEYADSSTTNEPEFVLTGIITETTSDMKAKEEEQIEEVVTEAEESSDVKDETVSEDTDTEEENPDNLIRFMPAAAELPHVKEAIKKYTDKSGVEIRNGFMEEISNATDSDIEPVLDKTSNEEDIKFTNMMNRRNEKANMSAY